MTVENALFCPVCGARTFYLNQDGTIVFFSLDRRGRPLRVNPTDKEPVLPLETMINCAHCSWSGTIAELLVKPGPKE